MQAVFIAHHKPALNTSSVGASSLVSSASNVAASASHQAVSFYCRAINQRDALRTAMADRHSSPHSPAWLPFRRPHQSICLHRLTAIALRRLPALSLSQIPQGPRFSGCSLMAMVTKVASTAPASFIDAQRSAPEESQQIAGDDIQCQYFRCRRSAAHLPALAHRNARSLLLLLDFSCSATGIIAQYVGQLA